MSAGSVAGERTAWRRLFALPKRFVDEVGEHATLAVQIVAWLFRPPFRLRLFVDAAEFVGVQSVFIIGLTGTFTGMVLALQSVYGFRQFSAEGMVGGVVALSLVRELAPVLGALMVISRACSAIATELGTMRVTDQIDALATMAVNPVQYLIVPRVVAGVTMMPILWMVFSGVGMVGAYLVAVVGLGIDPGIFIDRVKWSVDAEDLNQGLVKAIVFGFVVSLIACKQGYFATGGAAGVGVATTRAVVYGAVSVLLLNYVVTSILTPL